MISQNLRAALRPTSLFLLFVWAGQFVSFGIYYFIAHQSTSRGEATPESVGPMLPMVFGLIGGLSLLAGLGLRWFVFSQKRAQAFLARQMPAPSDASQDMTPE